MERVDHGVTSIRDPELVERLAQLRIPLTTCPLSNLRLKGVDDLADHAIKPLLKKGVAVTVNSDDPAYFGGYVNANYAAVIEALDLADDDVYTILQNGFEAAFLTDAERETFINKLDAHWNKVT